MNQMVYVHRSNFCSKYYPNVINNINIISNNESELLRSKPLVSVVLGPNDCWCAPPGGSSRRWLGGSPRLSYIQNLYFRICTIGEVFGTRSEFIYLILSDHSGPFIYTTVYIPYIFVSVSVTPFILVV